MAKLELVEQGNSVAAAHAPDDAHATAEFLKSIAHEARLRLLCHIHAGELSVSTLTERMNMRQALVSQHLARLRRDHVVSARRDGKIVYYRISDDRTRRVLNVVCPDILLSK